MQNCNYCKNSYIINFNKCQVKMRILLQCTAICCVVCHDAAYMSPLFELLDDNFQHCTAFHPHDCSTNLWSEHFFHICRLSIVFLHHGQYNNHHDGRTYNIQEICILSDLHESYRILVFGLRCHIQERDNGYLHHVLCIDLRFEQLSDIPLSCSVDHHHAGCKILLRERI